VAGLPQTPAYGAGLHEPALETVLWHRPCPGAGRFWHARRAAGKPRTSRLAGLRIHGQRLDLKHMVRLIVNSRTYKQVSTASKNLRTRDPYNRELARQSRWRIEAELVRDNALAIAGLLVP